MSTFTEVLSVIGFVIRALGFALLGFALGRFTLDSYAKAAWQVQIALAVGFFGLLVGLTNYSSPGSMGMFALGAGAAMLMSAMRKKEEDSSSGEAGKK
ncbi:MAG: hypothetical protein DPW18_13605 [Chloroflexi bacterium]|nr:hypothetical protein [Chloroflexota bacterium]MDL1943420.1 hypothetical protein [Chloroflexi bacterium CFX2]